MIDWFDETCGELLGYLDKEGLAKDTIVLYLSDNGWIQSLDKPQFAPRSKQSPNEGGLRTPIMVRWPGHFAPKMSDVPVSSVDLFPTILTACGVEQPKNLPGLNLADEAAVSARKTLYGECFTHNFVDLNNPAPNLRWRWILEDGWKLIVPAPQNEKGEPELYHVADDPNEDKNLATTESARATALNAKLDAWWPGKD